jgi:hypothetical protein
MIDFEYEGTITVDGVTQEFTGVATLDHPSGRLFKSPTSPGMGWWEYNAFMLDETYGLYQWKIVDGNGDIVFSEAATNYPDGKYHVGSLELEYTRFEDRETIVAPREWTNVVHADHGTFEYTVKAVGQDHDGVPPEPGTPLPNFLLLLDGTFTDADGNVSQVTGKGTGETVISTLNPQTNEPQQPW